MPLRIACTVGNREISPRNKNRTPSIHLSYLHPAKPNIQLSIHPSIPPLLSPPQSSSHTHTHSPPTPPSQLTHPHHTHHALTMHTPTPAKTLLPLLLAAILATASQAHFTARFTPSVADKVEQVARSSWGATGVGRWVAFEVVCIYFS